MEKYSVRYLIGGSLMTVDEDYRKTKKFDTLEEAKAEVEKTLENGRVKYCKIYKGRSCIEKIERGV